MAGPVPVACPLPGPLALDPSTADVDADVVVGDSVRFNLIVLLASYKQRRIGVLLLHEGKSHTYVVQILTPLS